MCVCVCVQQHEKCDEKERKIAQLASQSVSPSVRQSTSERVGAIPFRLLGFHFHSAGRFDQQAKPVEAGSEKRWRRADERGRQDRSGTLLMIKNGICGIVTTTTTSTEETPRCTDCGCLASCCCAGGWHCKSLCSMRQQPYLPWPCRILKRLLLREPRRQRKPKSCVARSTMLLWTVFCLVSMSAEWTTVSRHCRSYLPIPRTTLHP